MRTGKGFVLLCLLAFGFLATPLLQASDPGTGEWTMFGNGPGHSGFYPKTIGSGTFSEAWSKPLPTALNQVVIRADTIYGTTNGYFNEGMRAFALNIEDGSEKWAFPLPNGFSVNPPAYANGRLYFQRGNSSDTHLWCLDAASGRLLWTSPHSAQWERYLAPTIADGGVFVNGGTYGGMYGFDAMTGTQRFFVSLGQEDGWTPSYANGVLYTCVNGIFTAHNPVTGSQLWTRDLKTTSTGSGYGNFWHEGNVPVISDGKAAIVGGTRLVVVDLNSRTQLWSLPGNYTGTPAMAGGIVYAILGSDVKAYNASNGTLLGTYTGTGTLTGQPLVTNDLLIASGGNGTFIFDRNTFARKQTLSTGGSISYASGLLCVVKGDYYGGSTGVLAAYRVQPAEADPTPEPLPPAPALETRPNPSRPLGTTTAAWIDCVRANGVAYFLFDTPAKLERYELATGTWLEPISLPSAPKAVAVSTDAIYVSFGKSISAFPLDGTTETPLLNTANETRFLFERNGKLYLSDQGGAQWTVVDASTGTSIDAKKYSSGQKGVSVGNTTSAFFAISSSDISRTGINENGTLGTQTTSSYYGDYPSGTRTFLFPGDGRLVTDAGIVYSTGDLTYLGSLAGSFKDLDFTPGAAPVVLRDKTLVAYSTALLETGRYTLSGTPLRLFIDQDQVHSFAQISGRGVAATAIPLSSIAPTQPGSAIDPTNLTYTPDAIQFDGDNTVYLLSKLHQSIFRWSVSERKYLTSIPLAEVPLFMAYSTALNRLYLAYSSGRISYLDLASTAPSEVNFVNSPQAPLGLAAVDEFLFVCDPSGAWVSHYIYTPDGQLASSKDWKYYSREYVWSPVNRKLYFFRDDTSPNDLIWEDVDLEGKLGAEKDTPYHGTYSIIHPIRVSPDGTSVVLGSGDIYAGVSLERKGALPNRITDAVWLGGNLYTVRSVVPLGGTAATAGELQGWNTTYQATATGASTGVPLRLFPLADSLLVISQVDGKVRFARHGLDLAQLSSDPGSNPPPQTGPQPHPNPDRPLGTTTAKWIDSVQANGIVYFLFDTPAKVERYHIASESWLTPISLPAGPKAFTASPNGIFVSFGKNVSIFALDGSTETPLFAAAADVRWLQEVNGKLYVTTSAGHFGLVDITTGALLATKTNLFYSLTGLSFSAQKNKIFGRSIGVIPADIHVLALNADGPFGTSQDSPYHGAYPGASRTFVFPNGEFVADDSGIIYSTNNLSYAGSFAGAFDDLAFSGGSPVALRGNLLILYTTNFVETARATLAAPALRLFVSGQNAFSFAMQSGRGVTVTKTTFDTFSSPTPAPVVNPSDLAYNPDQIALGPDGTVFLLSKQHRNVFRWSVAERRYLSSIPLTDQPLHIAYSEAHQRLYVSYGSGRISWVDLSSGTFKEEPFANLPRAASGIAAAGEFLFAADPSGTSHTHYTFNANGALLSSKDWNYRSAEYVWNEAQRKMYFFRDDTTPNDLVAEPIDAQGTLGAYTDSPYHGHYSIIHPLRVSPDGSTVILGSGDIYSGTTLTRLGSLQIRLTDIAWTATQLFTLNTTSDTDRGELRYWARVGAEGAYSLADVANVQGTPIRLFPVDGGVLVVSRLQQKPRFSVYNDATLDLVSIDPAPDSSNPDPDPDPEPEPEPGSIDWPMVKGRYTAAFGAEDGQTLDNSGLLSIQLTRSGRFTGNVRIGSRVAPIKGSFSADGTALASFRSGGRSYVLRLQLAMEDSIPVLSGTLESVGWTASLEGSRAWTKPKERYSFAGRYSLVMSDAGEFIRSTVPPIAAVGTVKVNASGSTKLLLLGADGKRYSYGGAANEDGSLQVFARTHSGRGHLTGTLKLSTTTGEAYTRSRLHWIKPLQRKAHLYPLDISTDVEVSASRYKWQEPILDVEFTWPAANSAAVFMYGDLHETEGQYTYLNRKNELRFAKDTEETELKIDRTTGLVTGSFRHERLGKRVSIKAVVFPGRNYVIGYFLGLRSSGVFLLGPPPSPSSNSSSVVISHPSDGSVPIQVVGPSER